MEKNNNSSITHSKSTEPAADESYGHGRDKAHLEYTFKNALHVLISRQLNPRTKQYHMKYKEAIGIC